MDFSTIYLCSYSLWWCRATSCGWRRHSRISGKESHVVSPQVIYRITLFHYCWRNQKIIFLKIKFLVLEGKVCLSFSLCCFLLFGKWAENCMNSCRLACSCTDIKISYHQHLSTTVWVFQNYCMGVSELHNSLGRSCVKFCQQFANTDIKKFSFL